MQRRVDEVLDFPEFPEYKGLGMNLGTSTADKNSLRTGKSPVSEETEIN